MYDRFCVYYFTLWCNFTLPSSTKILTPLNFDGFLSVFFSPLHFSGGEVSEKVTISRKFKERVVQPILKVNIPLAINYSKPGKHFFGNKLKQTWVYKVKKNK